MKFLLIAITVLIVLFLSFGSTHSVIAQNGTIPPTPQSPLRVLVLGDSLTNGLYATHEQATFVSQIGEKTGYQMARRAGSTLPTIVSIWNEVKVWKPDIVIIEIGLNDVSKGTLTIDEWESTYNNLVVDIKSTNAIVVACTMFMFAPGRESDIPNLDRYTLFNSSIRKVANAQGINLADLWLATHDCKDCVSRASELSYFGPHYHGDNFHPSDHGHAVIAGEILRALGFTQYYMPIMESQP